MKSPLSLVSVLSLGLLLHGTVAVEPSHRVNGWYPCAYSTYAENANATTLKDMATFECAELEVPLCYDDVCESDRTINVFVRRHVAKMAPKDPSAPRKAGILVEGGPGIASAGMEDFISGLIDSENDSIDFYVFDHRGVGRSEFLQCDAASAFTAGSPNGVELSIDELATCVHDLNVQYDGQAAAFSVASAAMDIRSIIETFLSDHDVFIVGYSYGTYLSQRLMQLKVPQVKGYVLDGVDVVATKDDPYSRPYSSWEEWAVAPSRRLMEYCFDDPECPVKLRSRETALEDVIQLFDQLDTEPSECVKMMGMNQSSMELRMAMVMSVRRASTMYAGLERLGQIQQLQQCNAELKSLLANSETQAPASIEAPAPAPVPASIDVLNGLSWLLYYVIVSSERFQHPAPTLDERLKRIHDVVAAAPMDEIERKAAAYCAFTGSTDPACEEFKDELPTSNVTFFYEEHKYYEEPVTLPEDVAVILFTGGLDFQTPQELGEHLYEKLRDAGSQAMLVNFQYGAHTQGEATADAPGSPCRDSIARQFIQRGGDLAAIDLSCMAELPVAKFHAGPEVE